MVHFSGAQLTRIESLRTMPEETFNKHWDKIRGTMNANEATALTEEEIVRTLSDCVLPYFCIAIAVIARDKGFTLHES